jgi:hypothetical protein
LEDYMDTSNPVEMLKKAVGIAGGAALIAPAAPLAPPVLHGLAGIAVIGVGLLTAGSMVMKVAGALSGLDGQLKKNRSAMQPKE